MSDRTVEIGGVECEVKNINADVVASVANMLGELNLEGRKKLQALGLPSDSGDVIYGAMAVLTSGHLIRLAALLVNKDEEFVRKHFDLVWFTKAIEVALRNSNMMAVLKNLQSIAASFRE